MSYNMKDIEAVAMIRPVQSNNKVDVDALVYRAHVLRSQYITEKLSNLYETTVGRYKKHLKVEAAKRALNAMTDRELLDIGISRGEIDFAVEGKNKPMAKTASKSKVGFFTSLGRKFMEAQKARAATAMLMAMDSRQLADIGLTRGEIEIAVKEGKAWLANDNSQPAANNNGHREAV